MSLREEIEPYLSQAYEHGRLAIRYDKEQPTDKIINKVLDAAVEAKRQVYKDLMEKKKPTRTTYDERRIAGQVLNDLEVAIQRLKEGK